MPTKNMDLDSASILARLAELMEKHRCRLAENGEISLVGCPTGWTAIANTGIGYGTIAKASNPMDVVATLQAIDDALTALATTRPSRSELASTLGIEASDRPDRVPGGQDSGPANPGDVLED
jgi:hypothetical protein